MRRATEPKCRLSDRTKAALAAKKAQGARLGKSAKLCGGWLDWSAGRGGGCLRYRPSARQELQSFRAATLEALARGLNERGVRSARIAMALLSRTQELAQAR